MTIEKVTTNDFDTEVLAADGPVLVDFYADWCGPCRAQSPILDRVAERVGDAARIVKVDIDQDPELAQRYGVRSIPTLAVFENGAVRDVRVGVNQQADLEQLLLAS